MRCIKNIKNRELLAGHSNSYYELLERIPEPLRKKIRLVYNSGCGDGKDAEKYLKLGVGSYVGHVGTSYSWVFINAFQKSWKRGNNVRKAVEAGNTAVVKHVQGLEGKAYFQFVRPARSHSDKSAEKIIEGTHARAFGNTELTVAARYKKPTPRAR